ncbi:MAG: ribonuclease catalytic domain-containing protein, partial [Pyrinomonadaceae bacterium]
MKYNDSPFTNPESRGLLNPVNQHSNLDLHAMARRVMIDNGFAPDFPPDVSRELQMFAGAPDASPADASFKDMRGLLWSSIDNEESRDLDQVEYAERLANGDIRLLIGIADVDHFAHKGSALDIHALANTVSVYTPVAVFPMLPEKLSTDLSSLLEDVDRLAVVIELAVSGDGVVSSTDVYRAVVRNRAKLVYESAGAWLEGRASAPAAFARVEGLEEQIKLQDETKERLRALRRKNGALELESVEAVPIVTDGKITDLRARVHNRAQDIIESFMVAANTAMAEFLEAKGVPSLRRVVRTPERWPRIVELAESFGEHLPAAPDSPALAEFLARRRAADAAHYPDLSLSVMKLMGPGEYAVEAPGVEQEGHFGLAVHDYTHSTAPNRRYPDLVTQRCLKQVIAGDAAAYTRDELEAIAERCNRMEDAARKVERLMRKAAAAVLLSNRLGETFDAIVTGASGKGTFVRLLAPPAE